MMKGMQPYMRLKALIEMAYYDMRPLSEEIALLELAHEPRVFAYDDYMVYLVKEDKENLND